MLAKSFHRVQSALLAAVVSLIAVGLIAIDSAPVFAVDGVVDINEAVIAQGGFPFVISTPGSYRLTGNLSVPSGSDGIDVSADNVTVDLNGFAIVGSGGSGGKGISSTNNQITVRNGTVTGMGGDGIVLGDNAIVDGVHAISNGGNGITVGNSGMVTHCTVSANQSIGILLKGSGSMAIENSVKDNTSYGLQMNDTSSGIARNVFLFNHGNHTLGSLVPSQLNPAPSGVASQIGANMCNGNSCQ